MIEILLQAERALAVGQADQAERLYRQAADADPRNSIAVVGLARVALERGDDLAAYLLARRALSIDSENAAARRLADRLEEVMRYRGETPPVTPAVPDPRPVVSATARATEAAHPPSAVEPEPDVARSRPSLLDRLRRRG